jgi:hypothetical protein
MNSMAETQLIIEQYLAEGKIPNSTFQIQLNPEKHYLGALCKRQHDYQNSGKSVRGLKHDNCMICMRLGAYVWRQENLDRARATSRFYSSRPQSREQRKQIRTRWKASHPMRNYFYNLQGRAKTSRITFNLTLEYVEELFAEQNGRCYWLGVEMLLEGPPRHPMKFSIDRLIPELGYVQGNVVWTTNFANRARGNLPAEEFTVILAALGFPRIL